MTYDIGINEIVCTKRYEDILGQSIKYEAAAASRPCRCTNPKCLHEIKPHIHDTKHNTLKDIKAEGKIVIIDLSIRRYKCPDCGYVFPDEFTFFKQKAHITNRLKDEFVRRRLAGETFSYIARDYGVDDKTVAKAFSDYSEEHLDEEMVTYTPTVLGIDEAHIDDHYRLVLTDVGNKKLIDIKKNNKQPTVLSYLRTLDPNVCKVVTMDFAKGYAYAVMKALPNALIVIDHFHVIQEVNRCVDNVRKDLQNAYRREGYDIRVFKHSRKLFMANLEDLDDRGISILDRWFSAFPELYEAYVVKESLREIYECKDYVTATKMLDAWIDRIPDYERFNAMKKTFIERKEHILNYFRCGQTNAFTESVNNKIKNIEKLGRGYKFDVLRKICILSINKGIPEVFCLKDAVYVESDKIESFHKKVKDYNDTIADIERLLQTGMFHTAETKHDRVLFDPRYCKMPSLAVRRRVAFWMDDFTK